jgi:hypothetical protein
VRSTAPNTPARVRTWRPIMTFSTAERFAKSRMFWNVRAMPSVATRSGDGLRSGSPRNRISPSSFG